VDDARPCELYVLNGTGRTLVARGTIFERATNIHNMELIEDKVKVTVEEVFVPDALVHVPTKEVYIMAKAFRFFLACPRDLVGSIFDPLVRTPQPTIQYSIFKFTCYLCLQSISLDDPLCALH